MEPIDDSDKGDAAVLGASTVGLADGGSPGIDVGFLTSWFADRVGARPPLTFAFIPGGRSNLTHLVTDAEGRRFVHRRPPLHSTLSSAHDMGREHRIMSALAASDVPVPKTLGLDVDPEGAEFYVTAFIDGRILRSSADAVRLAPTERSAAALDLVDVLTTIHAVNPDAVGLGDLGRKQDYISRQLRRWYGQWQDQHTHDLPAIPALHDELTARIPEQQGVAIVHGDYRLDNTILGGDARVAAVLDWELCTLGDPLADVGLFQVYWDGPGAVRSAEETPVGALEGFPDAEELLAQYGRRSGLDVSRLGYYVAFGSWKLAVVIEGVYTRYLAGAYGDMDPRLAWYPERIRLLIDQAESWLERDG